MSNSYFIAIICFTVTRIPYKFYISTPYSNVKYFSGCVTVPKSNWTKSACLIYSFYRVAGKTPNYSTLEFTKLIKYQ